MVTADNLPESLTEYLTVWCADLLAPLDDHATGRVIATLGISYEGGPYPDRLTVQRLVEMHRGIVSGDAAVGEILVDTPAGVGSLIRDLGNPERREHALQMLSAWPDTTTLIPAVTAAADDGLLDEAERDTILATALRTPPLPLPVPLPQYLQPLPPDYPESYDDYFHRTPQYEWAPEISPD